MRKSNIFIMSLLLVNSLTFVAQAAPSKQPPISPTFIEHHFAGANLNESQRIAIQKMIDEKKSLADQETIKALDKLENKEKLRELALNTKFDKAEAKSLIADQSHAKQEKILDNLWAQNQIYIMLTPEQKNRIGKSKAGNTKETLKKQ